MCVVVSVCMCTYVWNGVYVCVVVRVYVCACVYVCVCVRTAKEYRSSDVYMFLTVSVEQSCTHFRHENVCDV